MTFTHAISTNNYGPAKFIVSSSAANGTHTTIASALTAASSGDTIFIRAGSYTENLTLKAGVNLTAFAGDSTLYNNAASGNVTIIGTLSASIGGVYNISNIFLQTNGALILSVTGTDSIAVILNQCFINATNNSAIACTSSNNNCLIELNSCFGNLGTTGINYFSMTNGSITIYNCALANPGGSTTANTFSNGSVGTMIDSSLIASITCNDGSILQMSNSGVAIIILNGTSQFYAISSQIGGGGTSSAITVAAGASAQLQYCVIQSVNTNAITGAGTVTSAGLIFSGSSVNNATTQVDQAFGTNVMFPTGGAIRTSKTATNTALLQAYNTNTTAYTTFATLTANNPPTFDLSSSTTIGGNPIGNVVASGFTTDGVVYSTGAATVTSTSAGTSGQLLQSGGAGVAPAYTTATYPGTTVVNQILFSNSTNSVAGISTANDGVLVTSNSGVPSILAGPGTTGNILLSNAAVPPSFSTSTYPSTNAVSTLLYASSANVMAALATANNGVLITSAGGVPSISSTLPSAVQGNITSVGNLGNQLNTTRAVFFANLGTQDSNVTGDGTVYTFGSGNALTVTQQGSSMSTTGTFTAPVTGYYLFCVNITLVGGTTATDAILLLGGTAGNLIPWRNLPKDTNNSSINSTFIQLISSGLTITFTIQVSGLTKTVGIAGASNGQSTVGGYLLC